MSTHLGPRLGPAVLVLGSLGSLHPGLRSAGDKHEASFICKIAIHIVYTESESKQKMENQFCNVILCFVLNIHLDNVVGFPLLGPGLGADVGVHLDPLLGEAPAAHLALRQPGLGREGGLGLGLGWGSAASWTLHLHPLPPR